MGASLIEHLRQVEDLKLSDMSIQDLPHVEKTRLWMFGLSDYIDNKNLINSI
ncbi:hypothetical protein H6G76_04110 [Nostoc sp. FACHB-152]|uniref:hypothetical protein n=1 Tax=unclassified Nostoc TaxID=2593658 RepID=UPI00168519E6|nr:MULTISPECIES: hypothetical protein [unclassified Nostoc]MBD2446357.1 hypothetical protein [Nostoc sp. FACHB-152]MBD2471814.1 hypothetical protein [Nostoc sp. FACHB-145]